MLLAMKMWLLALCALLAGCASDRVARGLVVGLVAYDGYHYYVHGDDGRMTRMDRPPEFAPERSVAVQDCTGPVNPEIGNLLCR
jgi:hypothetical protein